MAKVLSVPAGTQANTMGQQHHPSAMGHMHTQLTKSLERILEEAHLSGELKLSGRKLKDFPRTGGKYDLTDTVIADLSKNKFWELPPEVLEFLFVEKLQLYHNALRSLPEGLGSLQALRFLDLSRNQLCALPEGLCHLQSLEVLLVANNKLASLPDDIGNLKILMELDASCNEMTHLPRSLGRLKNLKAVDFRKNLLVELPLELTYLKLTSLDMSENRLSTLPVELRLMSSLERLRLGGNPLLAPPAVLVARGRVHIFKFLETQAASQERRRGGDDGRRTLRKTALPDLRAKRHTVDSGYSTSDGVDAKWVQDCFTVGGEDGGRKTNHIPGSENERGGDSPQPSEGSLSRSTLALDQLEAKRLILLQSNDRAPTRSVHISNGNGHSSPHERISSSEERRPLDHIQTYREYKEALRQQRAAQPQDVYRPRGDASTLPSPGDAPEKPVQKVPPSRVLNGDSKPAATNGNAMDYVKPVSPNSARPRQASPRPIKWTADLPADKLSFTMRREFERAKEEAELMGQLRHNIESRLRMALPEELGPALMDGVVLCHLANHVRPRSVASIHVPSPAVHGNEVVETPKLSMARCRRNVDNFLAACRKIGVEEGDLCCVEDVVASLDVAAVLRTVERLLHPGPRPPIPRTTSEPSPMSTISSGPSSSLLILLFLATCMLLFFLPHEE